MRLILLTLLLAPILAHAFEDENYGYQEAMPASPNDFSLDPDHNESNRVQDGRRLKKFELALQTLGIPLEPEPKTLSSLPRAGETSEESFLASLRFIDPEGGLKRYLNLSETTISLYRDFFSQLLPTHYLETSIDVRPDGPSLDSTNFMQRLSAIQMQVLNAGDSRPLEGVRIAIDPGHMGDPFWDKATGKFVQIRQKIRGRTVTHRVSEGQLTLWSALLVARELQNLGATVKVLREKMGPVSPNPRESYDIQPYVKQYFYDSLDGWMSQYLALGDLELQRKIKNFTEVKRMFPATPAELDDLRTDLFIKGEDLEARAQFIDQFRPDLTIDIHFDASISTRLQNRTNDVEGYVPGYFSSGATGSRRNRALALKHALESRRWSESVNFTSAITQALGKELGLPLLDAPAMVIEDQVVAVKVKNGVYARNLHITRNNTQGLVAYLECLHYDFTPEFNRMKFKDKKATIGGYTFQYPSRLDQVASGITKGVVNYFQNLSPTPGKVSFEEEQLEVGSVVIKR
jgi:N-acetylmuramoyl-L-alanine amidase